MVVGRPADAAAQTQRIHAREGEGRLLKRQGAERVSITTEGWAFRRAERPLPAPVAPLPLREKGDREAVVYFAAGLDPAFPPRAVGRPVGRPVRTEV